MKKSLLLIYGLTTSTFIFSQQSPLFRGGSTNWPLVNYQLDKAYATHKTFIRDQTIRSDNVRATQANMIQTNPTNPIYQNNTHATQPSYAIGNSGAANSGLRQPDVFDIHDMFAHPGKYKTNLNTLRDQLAHVSDEEYDKKINEAAFYNLNWKKMR